MFFIKPALMVKQLRNESAFDVCPFSDDRLFALVAASEVG
jgi:hypothetical protein